MKTIPDDVLDTVSEALNTAIGFSSVQGAWAVHKMLMDAALKLDAAIEYREETK